MDKHQEPITGTRGTSFKAKSPSQSKRDHWNPLIHAWRDSGLSQSAFCRKNHLNRPQFVYWRKKILGKIDKTPRSSTNRQDASSFVPVKVFDRQILAGLRVSLPNGIILSGIDEQNVALLKSIVQAL